MTTAKQPVSVHLDPRAKRRLEKAASLLSQSPSTFLEKAGDAMARRILVDWAVARYHAGERTFSELAEETGLAVEEIMLAMGKQGHEEALARFLESSRIVAEAQNNPEFLRLAEKVVAEMQAAGDL